MGRDMAMGYGISDNYGIRMGNGNFEFPFTAFRPHKNRYKRNRTGNPNRKAALLILATSLTQLPTTLSPVLQDEEVSYHEA